MGIASVAFTQHPASSTMDTSGMDRNDLVFMATEAEEIERYDDMKHFVKALAMMHTELEPTERALVITAYKHVSGLRRQALRVVKQKLENEQAEREETIAAGEKDEERYLENLATYKVKIESELSDICTEILNLLKDDLFPHATEAESKVEYAKMQGDYYRYMCEYTDAAQRADAINSAAAFYQTAFDVSMELSPGNATRLGLCLNFSVLYYEIMGKQEEAKKMAEDALRDSSRDTADENAESIISLLEDNLMMWNTPDPGEGEGGEEIGVEDLDD